MAWLSVRNGKCLMLSYHQMCLTTTGLQIVLGGIKESCVFCCFTTFLLSESLVQLQEAGTLRLSREEGRSARG